MFDQNVTDLAIQRVQICKMRYPTATLNEVRLRRVMRHHELSPLLISNKFTIYFFGTIENDIINNVAQI